MAIRPGYVARETGNNLVRNFTITLASIMTVAVSLALVGASLMAQQGVERATRRWQGGIEFIVFLNPEATPEQIKAVEDDLKNNPQIDQNGVTFVDKQAAYAEFKELFRDSPEMIDSVTPEILPASFRVEPKDKTADTITALSELYKTKPGVKQVVSATDTIKLVQKFSQFLTKVILVVAVSLLGVAVLLIMNTIRMAMYARRREIEVMKLVGATNWFIRVPFMAEGLVQGLFGVALSVGLLVVVRPWFQNVLPSSTEFPIFSDLVPASTDMLPIYLLMTVLGCLIGAGGAGIAVTRFLDV